MSMDNPNEYEKAIEKYAVAVREEMAAAAALEQARLHHGSRILMTQTIWRKVREYINEGKIKHGIYCISGPYHVEGVVLGAEDYPRLLPMFRK